MNPSGFLTRLAALTRKETRQMLRDRSNLVIGALLPAVLILLFGYGLSLDVTDARVAVVSDDGSPAGPRLLSALRGSTYIAPVWAPSMIKAERMMRAGEIDAILRIQSNFTPQFAGGAAEFQLILNGVDSNTAAAIESYVAGAIATPLQQRADRSGGQARSSGGVGVVTRMWFNEANESTWYLVPGLIVLVMTLIGAFLTSMLIAREWERGTLESLFVTPVRPLEIVLSKLAPYLLIGVFDLAMCLLAAAWLFGVPIRGSLLAIVVSSLLYLLVSLALGLAISGLTRNQFAASQLALLLSYMPAMMLSGFVFDVRNMPAPIQVISHLLPATHFMGLIKTLFLAGDYWPAFFRSCVILLFCALLLGVVTLRSLRKQLD
ncbi:MAG: hypothetical protein CMJ58_01530 [Planctomycetaceae bacterium]|nr:hypothetical protein [Planctomycetaceae bacterium]